MQTETTMQTDTSVHHAVTVVERRDEWDVVIVENGIERSQSFLQVEWALNYARGQRVRLGLPAPPEPTLQNRQ